MIKVKKLTVFFLTVILILSLAGCGNPQKRFIVYGRFQDNYTTDKFDVFCDWETINPYLDAREYKKYGLRTNTAFDNDDEAFRFYKEEINDIWLYDDLPNVVNIEKDKTGYVNMKYGAINRSSHKYATESYFIEPMIEVYIYNPNATNQLEPEYLPGYRAVYSLDGELALEEGQWFLEEDKDEFCRHYFEIMLKVIGKGK